MRALCKQLDNGVIYLTSRNEERGKEAVAKLNQEGLEPKFHQLDIADQASVDRLRDHLKETYGGLDVLINNAGIAFKVICSRLNASPYVFLSMRTILRTMETYQSALLRSSLSKVVLSPICTAHLHCPFALQGVNKVVAQYQK